MDKKEKQRIANKKWYQANKQKKLEYNKQWKHDNPEKVIKHKSNDYNNNKEAYKNRCKKWRKENPEKYIKSNLICGWREQGIITDDWENVHDIYMDTTNCNYCNKKFKNTLDRNLDHDHSINDSNNIRGILCRKCNIKDVLKGYPTIF